MIRSVASRRHHQNVIITKVQYRKRNAHLGSKKLHLTLEVEVQASYFWLPQYHCVDTCKYLPFFSIGIRVKYRDEVSGLLAGSSSYPW
jgi:hypothetical protein